MVNLVINPASGLNLPASFFFHLVSLLLVIGLLAFDLQSRQFPKALKTALSVLLAIKATILALFLFWGSSPIFSLALPLSDNLVSFLCLLWLTWAFRQLNAPKPFSQTVLGFSFALIVTATASFVLWLPQVQAGLAPNQPFHLPWLILSIGVLIFSYYGLARQEPRTNVFGLIYLLLITLGIVGEFIFPGREIYPRAELLGLIAIALYAFSFSKNNSEFPSRKPSSSSIQAAKPDLSPALASTMLEIGLKTEQSALLESLTHSLSLYLMADICGVTTRPSAGSYQMLKVFDLIREDYIESKDIPSNTVPGFQKADKADSPFIANRNGKGIEEAAFLQSTSYNQAGNLLYYPISSSQATRNYGLLCATPYTLKTWGEQEIYKLKVLRPKLQQLLEYSESLSEGLKTSNSPSKSMSAMDASRAELQEQMEKTNALLATIRADKNRLLEERTQQVRLWSERQRNLEDQVETLNKRLSDQTSAMQGAQDLEQEKNRLQDALLRNSTHLEQLKEALSTANAALHAITPEEVAGHSLFHSTEANTTVNHNKTIPASTRQRIEAEIRSNANLFARQGQTCVSTVQPIPDLDYAQTVRLSRILEQLQRNACSASPNYGQVKVDVLSGEPEGKRETIEICITDYGGGLSPTELQHFLKYISCNTSPVPVGIGDACALREALDLVKSSGGHLWVNNPEPNATAYRILLPVIAENGWKLEEEG